ncbi:hypothetical protein [Blastococcus sp. CT_GayMR16]|uniref:hypothetical protein n=1 Tax=Blastococcus sp. CT_GayMR16 TaxID=2559607 RepID=UPI001073B1C1|nr:hypothetical protein [Blastococcus sp. CT_GayMR16]TFV91385.1 hypothetical protein E4P38_02015 [Blastococcus sp. CT_GayMR16]
MRRALAAAHWVRDHWLHLVPAGAALAVITGAILKADVGTIAITTAMVIMLGWIYGLTYTVQNLRDDVDTATDDSDQAIRLAHDLKEDMTAVIGTVNQVIDHLDDTTPAGRHSRPHLQP